MTKISEVFKRNCKNPHIIFLSFLALLSGILIGTSYIPYPPWAIAFCYLPLWWATILASDEKSYKSIFLLGWISQFVLTLLGFNWIYFTAREFGHLNIPVSLAALVLFASFVHLYIPFSLVAATYLKRKFSLSTTSLIFTLALVHILFERSWPSIFEWNLGYTLLWIKSPLAQWADTIGFWGLSALIFIFQAVLLYSVITFKVQKTKAVSVLAGLVVAVTGLWFAGDIKKLAFTNSNDPTFKVTIVQANISNEEKLQAEKGYDYQPFVFNSYFEATDKELARVNNETDLIIWPETALPVALDKVYHPKPSQQSILNRVKGWQKTLVTGAYSQDQYKRDHMGNLIIRNSVFFLNSEGEIAAPYFKTDLLVFGEYMPFGQEAPFLYKLFPFVGVYERGPGPIRKAIPLGNHTLMLGPQICYESLNPGFSRGLAKVGSEVFFNLTNDSWFGDWAEPYQHMIMTLARGLENRRPLIRSTNTGISTIILANGDILEQSPIYRKWASTYTVPYKKNPELTFYSKYGYWDWALWVLILLYILERGRRAHNKKS